MQQQPDIFFACDDLLKAVPNVLCTVEKCVDLCGQFSPPFKTIDPKLFVNHILSGRGTAALFKLWMNITH